MIGNALSIGIPIFGGLYSANKTIEHGQAYERAKNFEADQMVQNAAYIEAKGSHDIEDSANKYEVLISRAIALNGHQGGGGSDAQFLKMVGDLAMEGERSRQRISFGYKTKSQLMKKQAAVTRFEAREYRKGTKSKAIGTLLSGVGQAATNYLAGGKYQAQRLASFS